MISLVFPGQGSQKVGMGSDLYNKFDYVKKIFKNADETLGYKIIRLNFKWTSRKTKSNNLYTTSNIFNWHCNL